MLTPRSYSLNTSQKQSFSKPFLTIDEQLAQLKSRGMKFYDEKEAKHYLEHLNYYRLGGYWLLFELDHETHTFKENVYFEEVLNLYIFDRERKHRQAIAKDYGIDEKILSSFLHHLTTVRNVAAHHSRLWNRKFTIDFVLPNHPPELNQKFNQISKKYIYNTLVMCEYLMSTINKDSIWKSRLEELINLHKMDTTRMGYKSI